MRIRIPYETMISKNAPPSTYKLLTSLTLFNLGSGYTCFIKTFMLFVSDREIKTHKSDTLKKFQSLLSVDQVKQNLPVVNISNTGTTIIEIDVSKSKQIKTKFGLKNLDCTPLLWIASINKKEDLKYEIK